MAKLKELKAKKVTDKECAALLGLTIHQIGHLRVVYGIGGRYAKMAAEMNDDFYHNRFL